MNVRWVLLGGGGGGEIGHILLKTRKMCRTPCKTKCEKGLGCPALREGLGGINLQRNRMNIIITRRMFHSEKKEHNGWRR